MPFLQIRLVELHCIVNCDACSFVSTTSIFGFGTNDVLFALLISYSYVYLLSKSVKVVLDN